MLRSSKNTPGLIGALIGLSLLMLFLFPDLQREPLGFLTRPLTHLMFQIQRGFSSIGDGIFGIWDGYLRLRSVRDENIRLRQALAQLQNENIRLLEAEQANARLTRLLDLKTAAPFSLIAARVTGTRLGRWILSIVSQESNR